MPSLLPQDRICFALYSASHAMNRLYKPMLDQLGLTYPQYLTLTALWSQDGQTVGQLGQQLMLDSNTLTPLLKRMESSGLIRRNRATADERQVIISLTDAGQAMEQRAAHLPACVLEATGLDLDELVSLREQVTELRDKIVAATRQKAEQKGEDG